MNIHDGAEMRAVSPASGSERNRSSTRGVCSCSGTSGPCTACVPDVHGLAPLHEGLPSPPRDRALNTHFGSDLQLKSDASHAVLTAFEKKTLSSAFHHEILSFWDVEQIGLTAQCRRLSYDCGSAVVAQFTGAAPASFQHF